MSSLDVKAAGDGSCGFRGPQPAGHGHDPRPDV